MDPDPDNPDPILIVEPADPFSDKFLPDLEDNQIFKYIPRQLCPDEGSSGVDRQRSSSPPGTLRSSGWCCGGPDQASAKRVVNLSFVPVDPDPFEFGKVWRIGSNLE